MSGGPSKAALIIPGFATLDNDRQWRGKGRGPAKWEFSEATAVRKRDLTTHSGLWGIGWGEWPGSVLVCRKGKLMNRMLESRFCQTVCICLTAGALSSRILWLSVWIGPNAEETDFAADLPATLADGMCR